MNKKKELIILVGNIGCGKTTLSHKYVKAGYVAIARDYLRYAIGVGDYVFNADYESIIWKTEQYMFKHFLKLGVNIIVDEVGISKKLRKGYIKLGKEYNYNITCVILPLLDMKKAVDRRMNNPHGQENRKLWEGVYNKFSKMYKEPTIKEGFNSIIKLTETKGEEMTSKYCPKCDMIVVVKEDEEICSCCGEQLQGEI